jgi:Zn-dependent peptidase ImmA (M78 family)
VEDGVLPEGAHADTDVANRLIRIRESVYDDACSGNGRDRMTIAHEIGHLLLICEFGFALRRNFSKREVMPYEDPEWHAKCLAGELLAPSLLIGGMTVDEVASVFGVSREAAVVQLGASIGRRKM